jgi:hypothetical protein
MRQLIWFSWFVLADLVWLPHHFDRAKDWGWLAGLAWTVCFNWLSSSNLLYGPAQRVTKLSCGRLIRLLAHPLPPSASCLSFSVFQCVASRAYWRKRGWARNQIIGPGESLALYKLFSPLWSSSKIKIEWLISMLKLLWFGWFGLDGWVW